MLIRVDVPIQWTASLPAHVDDSQLSGTGIQEGAVSRIENLGDGGKEEQSRGDDTSAQSWERSPRVCIDVGKRRAPIGNRPMENEQAAISLVQFSSMTRVCFSVIVIGSDYH